MKKRIQVCVGVAAIAIAAISSFPAPAAETRPQASVSVMYDFADADLKAALEGFVGAPYVVGGRDEKGIDAAGLARRAFGKAGVKLPASVAQMWTSNALVESSAADLQFGDLLFFRLSSESETPNHIAVYMGEGEMIHADPKTEKTHVEKYPGAKWKSNLVGIRRAPRGRGEVKKDENGESLNIDALKASGRAFLGVPFRRGGRSESGIDSAGLLVVLFGKAGVELDDVQIAGLYASRKLLDAAIESAKFGDILFFSSSDDSSPTHAAIYWGDGMMLRASEAAGRVVLENIDKPLWKNTLVGTKRFPKIKKAEPSGHAGEKAGFDADKLRAVGDGFVGAKVIVGAVSREAVDSASLIFLVFKEVGVELPITPVYAQFMSASLENVAFDSLRFGDIVFFDTTGDGRINHAGIYWDKNRFLHASASAGKVIFSDIKTKYWKGAFVGARRAVKSD